MRNYIIIQRIWTVDHTYQGERSGSVLDPRPRGRGFEPHQRHCVVSLSMTHLSLVSTGSTQEYLSWHNWKIGKVTTQCRQWGMNCNPSIQGQVKHSITELLAVSQSESVTKGVFWRKMKKSQQTTRKSMRFKEYEYWTFGNFRQIFFPGDFIFVNRVKRHICDAKSSRRWPGLHSHISKRQRDFTILRRFYFTKLRICEVSWK